MQAFKGLSGCVNLAFGVSRLRKNSIRQKGDPQGLKPVLILGVLRGA